MIRRMLLGLTLAAILASPASTQPDGLATLDRAVQSGVHGYVDHVLVLRNGQVAFDKKYPRDVKSVADQGRSPPQAREGARSADDAIRHRVA